MERRQGATDQCFLVVGGDDERDHDGSPWQRRCAEDCFRVSSRSPIPRQGTIIQERRTAEEYPKFHRSGPIISLAFLPHRGTHVTALHEPTLYPGEHHACTIDLEPRPHANPHPPRTIHRPRRLGPQGPALHKPPPQPDRRPPA